MTVFSLVMIPELNYLIRSNEITRNSILFLLLFCNEHPCLTDPSKVLILLGVSSQVLGGELETQICLG